MRVLGVLVCTLFASGAMANCSEDEQPTYDLIHSYLDSASSLGTGITTGEIVGLARSRAVSARDGASKVDPTVLRNAAYYLHGFYAGTAEDFEVKVWVRTFPEAYDAVKWAAHELRDAGYPWLEGVLRDNPNQATTPPGGAEWARRGISDGKNVPNSTMHVKSDQHGFQVPCRDQE